VLLPFLAALSVAASPGSQAAQASSPGDAGVPLARPERRGPVATGTVLAADGKPAAGATVYWFMRLAGGMMSNGGAKVAADGAFALPHPRPDDPGKAMEPTQLVMWAKRQGEASAAVINRPGPVTIRLQAYDPARLAQVRVVALDQGTQGRWGGDLQVLLAPGCVDGYGPRRLKAGRVLDLAGAIPGPQALLLFDDVGFHAGDEIGVEAAKENVIEMPFAADVPEGRVGVHLAEKEGRIIAQLVVPGSPAQRAGLKMGDELLAIDGQPAAAMHRSGALLQGKPGDLVRVTVRRGQDSQELQMRRSGPREPLHANVHTQPLVGPDPEITAAAAFIQARAGERIVDVAPLHTSARRAGEPFLVQVPEGVERFGLLRVIVDFGKALIYEPGIPIVITARGPSGFELEKRFSYYNMVRDPLGRGGDMSTGGLAIGFDPGELDTEGVHQLTVRSPGRGQIERTFRVTGPLTGQGYQRHQHRRIGGYEMRARGVLELQPKEGSPDKAQIHRAVFTSGEHTVEVDMVERLFGGEVQDWFFASPPWPSAREVLIPLRRQAFKLHLTGSSFVAAWPSGSLVVRIRGTRWGKEEEQLIDHYVMFYESRWVRDGR